MRASEELSILAAAPPSGVPGGDVVLTCCGFKPGLSSKALLGDVEASILSASADRVIVRLPESPQGLGIALKTGRKKSPVFPFNLASTLATDLHPVANPVVAEDGSVITTISGSRGQQVPQPLVRITRSGEKMRYGCEIMNPTGLAFSRDGSLYISSRHDGTVLRYEGFERLEVVAEDLGIPCGLAFDSEGALYVGDRTGSIYRISASGERKLFANLEPSISAYHLAIDAEDRLYVTGPTISMRDPLIRFNRKGDPEILIDGLARPQGMAFLPDGDLLVSAGYDGRKGIFHYSQKDKSFVHYLAAPMLVGLAVAGHDIFLATANTIYYGSLPGKSVVN